ncbi:MAG: DNA polymerase III subunit delta [Kineosporiaceae bacterium]
MLLTGPEEFLAERALSAVLASARTTDPEVRLERLDAASCPAGALAAATSPSLFGGGVVLLAEGVDKAGDAFVTEATAYVGRTDPDIVLVLRHAGGNRARPLLEAARKAGGLEVACQAPAKDEEKADFVVREFRRLGCTADADAVRALVDAVGSDLRELAAACRQLRDDHEDAGGGSGRAAKVTIGREDVDRYFSGRIEVTGFKVADAAVGGDGGQALQLLRHALSTGVDPVPLVAVLAMKVRALAKVSSVGGRGRSADLARDLGMAPWQIDRARRELQGWSQEGLARAVLAVADADTAVKGGGRDPVYAVERAVLTVAQARGIGVGRG